MTLEEAKTVMRSNIVLFKETSDPGVRAQIKALKLLLDYIERLEGEHKKLTAKINYLKLIKDQLPGGE